jgi:hypothetical protein
MRILGKQKGGGDEYKLFYLCGAGLGSVTVTKLDTILWLHLGAGGLANGIVSVGCLLLALKGHLKCGVSF